MSMKNPSDPIGNRTHELPASTAYNLSKKMKTVQKGYFVAGTWNFNFIKVLHVGDPDTS
jgi:hypothetical protein